MSTEQAPKWQNTPKGRSRGKPVADRFWEKVDKTPGHGPNGDCWIWVAGKQKRSGYGVFDSRLAHRTSYELAKGMIPDGLCVLHSCDIPACVNPQHLSVGTQADNIRDCQNKGRQSRCHQRKGEDCTNSKLKTYQVIEIRRLWEAGGISKNKLATMYGVTQRLIRLIVERKSWKHV